MSLTAADPIRRPNRCNYGKGHRTLAEIRRVVLAALPHITLCRVHYRQDARPEWPVFETFDLAQDAVTPRFTRRCAVCQCRTEHWLRHPKAPTLECLTCGTRQPRVR
jgi:hypothetical protein